MGASPGSAAMQSTMPWLDQAILAQYAAMMSGQPMTSQLGQAMMGTAQMSPLAAFDAPTNTQSMSTSDLRAVLASMQQSAPGIPQMCGQPAQQPMPAQAAHVSTVGQPAQQPPMLSVSSPQFGGPSGNHTQNVAAATPRPPPPPQGHHGIWQTRNSGQTMGRAPGNQPFPDCFENGMSKVAAVTKWLKTFTPDEFAEVYFQMPEFLQAAVLRCPPGVTTNTASLDREERLQMCKRLNELRRLRCRPLAPDNQQQYYEEENFTVVPMSMAAKTHFWELFFKIPIATTNPGKWRAVLKHLDSCPEKPEKSTNPKRHLETGFLPDDADSRLPKRGRVSDLPLADSESDGDGDAEQLITKAKVDARATTAENLSIPGDYRLARMMKPLTALRQMPALEHMGSSFGRIYKIYLKRFDAVMSNAAAARPGGKKLAALMRSLNISGTFSDDEAPEVLARFKALELCQKPH